MQAAAAATQHIFIHPAYPLAIRADLTCPEYYVAFDVYWTAPQPMLPHVPPDTNRNHPRQWPPKHDI